MTEAEPQASSVRTRARQPARPSRVARASARVTDGTPALASARRMGPGSSTISSSADFVKVGRGDGDLRSRRRRSNKAEACGRLQLSRSAEAEAEPRATSTIRAQRRANSLCARRMIKIADAPTCGGALCDAAGKDDKIEATPLCLLFGQGHQHFLDRLATIPRTDAPPPRGRGKNAVTLSAAETLHETLFEPLDFRQDPTPAFRWDPAEDVRYALRADDPSGQKSTTQHGANRLAAFGLPILTVTPGAIAVRGSGCRCWVGRSNAMSSLSAGRSGVGRQVSLPSALSLAIRSWQGGRQRYAISAWRRFAEAPYRRGQVHELHEGRSNRIGRLSPSLHRITARRRAELARRLEEPIHDRDDHVVPTSSISSF